MAPERPRLTGEETKIHELLKSMGEAIDQAINQAVSCLLNGDITGAEAIVAGDTSFNDLQYQVEEECINTMALQQPVAGDLRDLIADAFIAAELERIADHAADIAAIVPQLTATPRADFADALTALSGQARGMLADVMAAYVARDAAAACAVAKRDDGVDRDEASLTERLIAHMCDTPADVRLCTRLQWAAHHLERIADRVTNIAERIVYVVNGEVVDLNNNAAG